MPCMGWLGETACPQGGWVVGCQAAASPAGSSTCAFNFAPALADFGAVRDRGVPLLGLALARGLSPDCVCRCLGCWYWQAMAGAVAGGGGVGGKAPPGGGGVGGCVLNFKLSFCSGKG